MLDQPRGDPDDDEPIWHPSGWSPVFVGDEPGRPRAVLIGHTRRTLPTHVVRRIALTSRPADDDEDAGFLLHGEMVLHACRQDGMLIWAWHLERPEDEAHIPDFRPVMNS